MPITEARSDLVETNRVVRRVRDVFSGRVYQTLAILFCLLFGIAMILNTQMGGEAEWFWYANLFHNGAKLYADLHLALQPLYVLATNAWIQLFGIKCLVTEIPSVLNVLIFCLAIFLILQESDWSDWQKAIVLAGAFFITVECTAYRFDDFHVTTEIFVFYSLVLLLKLAKADAAPRRFGLAAVAGVLSGLTITTRLTDGAALLVATGICLLFLARKQALPAACLFIVTAALTVLTVVKLTGDTLSAYASNSIFRAAGAKGGTHGILEDPFLIFRHTLSEMHHGNNWILLYILPMIAVGALLPHLWKAGAKYTVTVQLALVGIAVPLTPHYYRAILLSYEFVRFLCLLLLVVNYLLAPVVIARYVMSRRGVGKLELDPREILVLIPLAELASASASTGAHIENVFFSPIAMLLLLAPIIQPFRKLGRWANLSLVSIIALLGISAMGEKIYDPYSWLNFRTSPMFVNRQWYRHPVYGPMYLDRGLLHFIQPVCREIKQGGPTPELLSMPYSYPNYFCDIPPWHGYVQTFFDTSTRSTIEGLMSELDTSPPQWIVYQRQMKILGAHETLLNHGQPLPHRALDEMIMRKIAVGKWHVVDKSSYLVFKGYYLPGDGWWIIRTR